MMTNTAMHVGLGIELVLRVSGERKMLYFVMFGDETNELSTIMAIPGGVFSSRRKNDTGQKLLQGCVRPIFHESSWVHE